MNRPLRHIAIFCGLLMLALLIRTNWLQYAKSEELATHEHNRRVKITQFATPRGDIIVGGKAVTGSKLVEGTDFKYQRTFKQGPMYAPVTGYASQAQGMSLLEKTYDSILSGQDERFAFRHAKDILTGEERRGGGVVTTIVPKAQEVAYKDLTELDARGAVVALEPSTGKVLALVSTPSYDPSVFAGNSFKEGDKFQALIDEKSKPLANRPLRETFPPGSTFKILTAAAALEHGVIDDVDAPTEAVSPYPLPLSTKTISSEAGDAACNKASLKVAMQFSCNNVFLDAALKVGDQGMRETAEKFGFNEDVYSDAFGDMLATKSLYPDKLDKPGTALTGMGQGSLTSTPMQMAMVTAALANNGKLMQPYIVDKLVGPDLTTLEEHEPQLKSDAVSEETAKKIQEMMEFTAKEGSAKRALIDGVTVGGKTGTAQRGNDVTKEVPYGWFVSYGKKADGQSVAVAVFIDPTAMDISRSDISGGGLGGPIARNVMKAVLGK
ncbi:MULTISPECIES: penicillin-binding protein 2 [Streptomyces]|uniref:Penicillin-binding transpeptidase domain-containing protein n=1 Tax=Streptomyces glycanivorans TaxID=3033808 RepID=A0ABY9JDM8_9ACTN|nr:MULTISPECIES: penicillin-binding transpeptidase domain-containing protein [unclassified Streptomyces]WSQ79252.1 penicillin-binding transpeptidase domain-containing protein [Streptomyces sp. NBC_01213]TXS15976.1 penicillin-binding protein 2 [Streptomyces sp. wa22]WLQ65837.1 penicillin-binding transpeptidase domain-containing protein [Streptomyces sp. Alt3]WSQ86620.1 penicillin-binding transpeptidase domain-containing protein [Streptomyces sp. NBC_01212]WSR07330.1 penicillin-binding transpept